MHACIPAGIMAMAVLCPTAASQAATTLTVDLSTSYRPATHVGIGFLYGVTEKLPADDDLADLVGALHPRMITNPASSDPGTQQPGIPANAIKVAARLAPLGATVTVRLADWFPGWYAFTNMTDWFSKIGTTIAAKKTANLDNIYAYEIWNEPNGSWTNGGDTNAVPGGTKTLSWNAFWKQSYDKIRQLDPAEKITGPSLSYMDPDFIKGFLTYCKANDCLPDIIGWHEGMNIEADVSNYRTLEKQLGVGPLPISINEYSGSGRAKDEGRPGATVPLIAQLERAGVDTACVSWWTPDSIAGHLGSLLASDTQANGGWFLFQWYGEMNGGMVMTTPSLAKDGKNLDGFANLETGGRKAHVIVGGVSDGTVQIMIKGWKAAPGFGNRIRAAVERTHWLGRGGVVTSAETPSTTELTVANDQIIVTIGNANNDDGYRVTLTPMPISPDGGVADADGGSIGRDSKGTAGDGPGEVSSVQSDARLDTSVSADTGATSRDASIIEADAATDTGNDGKGGQGGASDSSWDSPSDGAPKANATSACSCAVAGKNTSRAWGVPLLFPLLIFHKRGRRLRKVAIRSFFSGIVSFTAHVGNRRIDRVSSRVFPVCVPQISALRQSSICQPTER
jgi:hypothetical protein